MYYYEQSCAWLPLMQTLSLTQMQSKTSAYGFVTNW